MTRYIFCVIAVLVQPLFVWYVYHKHDKREAALKIPMIGCSVLYLVVQVYAFFKLCIKIPGKYGIFSYLVQANSGSIYSSGTGFVRQQQIYKKSSGKRAEFNTRF